MIDLDEVKQSIQNGLDNGELDAEALIATITSITNELRQHREHAKACCCKQGEKLVDGRQFTSKIDPENPFPSLGYAVCDVCYGANVMVSMNMRQRARIERLMEEQAQDRFNYEQLEKLYEKTLAKLKLAEKLFG